KSADLAMWIAMVILLAAGVDATAEGLASFREQGRPKGRWRRLALEHPEIATVTPIFLSACLLALLLTYTPHPWLNSLRFWVLGLGGAHMLFWTYSALPRPLGPWLSSQLRIARKSTRYVEHDSESRVITLCVVAFFSGAIGGALLFLLKKLLPMIAERASPYSADGHLLVIGGPLVVLVMEAVNILFVGLAGRSLPDGKREWLARARGALLRGTFLW